MGPFLREVLQGWAWNAPLLEQGQQLGVEVQNRVNRGCSRAEASTRTMRQYYRSVGKAHAPSITCCESGPVAAGNKAEAAIKLLFMQPRLAAPCPGPVFMLVLALLKTGARPPALAYRGPWLEIKASVGCLRSCLHQPLSPCLRIQAQLL